MAVTENVTPLHAPDALPPMNTSGRVDRLRELLDGAGCDALVVTNLTNVRYLVGFSGSAGQLLVTAERAVFVTDGRYRDQSADEIAAAGLADAVEIEIVGSEPDAALAAVVSGSTGLRLGLEADAVTWTAQRRWANDLVSAAELVADVRRGRGVAPRQGPRRGGQDPFGLRGRRRGVRHGAIPAGRRRRPRPSSRSTST